MSAVDSTPRDYRSQVTRIRRTRLHPRRTDYLYLHLRRLRDDLQSAISDMNVDDVLDVYCGTRPYEPLFPPNTRYVGFDIDDAYGCADVVSDEFLPFPDASFDLCLCTQAFYFIEDRRHAVEEFMRVLRPGGQVLLTVPIVYPGTHRLYTELQLRETFAGWRDVVAVENGRTVASIVTLTAYLLHQCERRTPRTLRPVLAAVYAALNTAGEVMSRAEARLAPSLPTLPPNLLFRATRP